MTLKVGLIQQSCGLDKHQNLVKTRAQIRAAANKGARLVVLQELHGTRYFCQTEDVAQFEYAESIPGPSSDALSVLAKELEVVIVSSLFERRTSGIYHNTAVVLESDGSIAGVYRKMHIPDDPGFYEKFYFTPGDLGFQPVETSVGRLGVLVCWDQWFPEAARLMTLAGADLLIYPTAIGWDPHDDHAEQQRQLDAWITVQRGHAIANAIPLIAVNRVGLEENPIKTSAGILFWGNSFAVGQQGEILAQATTNKDELVSVDIDLSRTEQVRRIWPFLRDRRIDDYFDIVRRFID